MTVFTLQVRVVVHSFDERVDDFLLIGILRLRYLPGKFMELRVNGCISKNLIAGIGIAGFIKLKIFSKLCYFLVCNVIGIL